MITKLEDFLRRRSKIALIGRKEEIARAPGLMEACQILFGTDARAKYEEYFEDLAFRESLMPAPVGSTPPEELSHPA
jgi:glycerol-3-phosphate dehydrogenase